MWGSPRGGSSPLFGISKNRGLERWYLSYDHPLHVLKLSLLSSHWTIQCRKKKFFSPQDHTIAPSGRAHSPDILFVSPYLRRLGMGSKRRETSPLPYASQKAGMW